MTKLEDEIKRKAKELADPALHGNAELVRTFHDAVLVQMIAGVIDKLNEVKRPKVEPYCYQREPHEIDWIDAALGMIFGLLAGFLLCRLLK